MTTQFLVYTWNSSCYLYAMWDKIFKLSCLSFFSRLCQKAEAIVRKLDLSFHPFRFDLHSLTFWDVFSKNLTNLSFFFRFFFLQFVILVVDSTDRERLSISKEELHKMLGHEELSKAAILVFANKQDVKGCMSVAEISKQLNLQSMRKHNWQIQACCALSGEGWAIYIFLIKNILIIKHKIIFATSNSLENCFLAFSFMYHLFYLAFRLYQGLEWIVNNIKKRW